MKEVAMIGAGPLGPLKIELLDGHLVSARVGQAVPQAFDRCLQNEANRQLVIEITEQLKQYLTGERADFRLPLRWPPGRPFARRVWQQLLGLKKGQVISYGQLAQNIGNPLAARAVGQAVGANPLLLIVPCHRVVAKKRGELGGFSAGLWRKRWLLEHEGVLPTSH